MAKSIINEQFADYVTKGNHTVCIFKVWFDFNDIPFWNELREYYCADYLIKEIKKAIKCKNVTNVNEHNLSVISFNVIGRTTCHELDEYDEKLGKYIALTKAQRTASRVSINILKTFKRLHDDMYNMSYDELIECANKNIEQSTNHLKHLMNHE